MLHHALSLTPFSLLIFSSACFAMAVLFQLAEISETNTMLGWVVIKDSFFCTEENAMMKIIENETVFCYIT